MCFSERVVSPLRVAGGWACLAFSACQAEASLEHLVPSGECDARSVVLEGAVQGEAIGGVRPMQSYTYYLNPQPTQVDLEMTTGETVHFKFNDGGGIRPATANALFLVGDELVGLGNCEGDAASEIRMVDVDNGVGTFVLHDLRVLSDVTDGGCEAAPVSEDVSGCFRNL